MRRNLRIAAALLAASIVTTVAPAVSAAESTENHWAHTYLETWKDYGVMAGDENGDLMPDKFTSRAELAVMLNAIMDYQVQAENTFPDVEDGSWYTHAILGANAAGLLSGYPDGSMGPGQLITRQEAVVMMANVLELDGTDAPDAGYLDGDDVAAWARWAVNAMTAKGYIGGFQGRFCPNDPITRGEIAVILSNIFSSYIAQPGTYTHDVDGNMVISAGGVTLKGQTISGDLIIAEGVGDGHIVLDGVTVAGKLIVRGGGENSIIITGGSKIGVVAMARQQGQVRLSVEDGARVDAVMVNDGSEAVKIEGKVEQLTVSASNVVVTVTGSVGDIHVQETAQDSTVILTDRAQVNSVTVAADNTQISAEKGAQVEEVVISSASSTVSGSGTVGKVEATEQATGTTVTTPGTKVENNSADSITTDQGTVKPGDSGTTSGGGSSGGSASGGGSSGGSVHTHSYVDGICEADGALDPTWAQVNSAETWNRAAAEGKNIIVTQSFTAQAQLLISRGLTVNGNNETIRVEEGWTDAHPDAKGDASLVLINGVDEAVVLKNLTLTGAKSLGEDFGHGLNVVDCGDVTLNNVTLTDHEGVGMVVNSSTVRAEGLHTAGNRWTAGVNIDANISGDSGIVPASFTFDDTSTFDETVAVYSDGSTNVSVTCPEGWAPVTQGTKTAWVKLFAGGRGTQQSPYEIATAGQLVAVDQLSNQMMEKKPYHFILTQDIDYTQTTDMIAAFCGTLDGNGHAIEMDASVGNVVIWETYGDVTIQDLTMVQMGREMAVLVATLNGSDGGEILLQGITFTSGLGEDVIHENQSYGLSQFGMWACGKVSFIDCVNEVSYTLPTTTGDYIGIFVGNYIKEGGPSMFSFINCVNKGTVSANQLGFFVGNSAQPSNGIFLVDSPNYVNDRTDAAAIYVSGCRNEGVMLATLKCEPFLSVNSSHKFDAVNAQLLEAGDQVFYSGTMSLSNVRDMGLSVYNDQVQIIPSVENQEITTYGLNCAVSTSYKYASGESAGSWYFSLTEYVDADQAASRTFKYITKVMLDTDYDLTAPEGERYEELAQAGVKYDQHGNEYILVALEDGTWAAVINSAQALDNFEDGDVMWCGSVPTYTLTVQNAMGQNIGAIKYSAPDIPQKEEEEEPDQGTSSFVPSDFRLEANAEYGISLSMTPPSDQDGIEESISFAYAADGQPVINRSLDKNVRSTMFLLEYSGLEAGSNEIVVDVTATPAGGGAETDAYKTSFAVTLQVSDLAAEALPDGASAQLTQVGDGSAVALSGLEENQIYEVQMLYSDSSVARVKIACTDENGALDCGSSDAAEPITGVRLVKLEFGQVEEDSASVTRQSYTGILPVQTESSQA